MGFLSYQVRNERPQATCHLQLAKFDLYAGFKKDLVYDSDPFLNVDKQKI